MEATTPIGNFIKTKDFGPITKTLIYLDDSDLMKLSFVTSSSKKEMGKNYEEFRRMRLMGRKVETDKFDPKCLSFYKFIQEINLFVDSIPKPLKLSEKDKRYILDHRKEYIMLSNTNDHHARILDVRKEYILSNSNDHYNIRFGIEIGEKIDKSVITAIFIRDRTSMFPIIETLIENYSDLSFVYNMLPIKAIATVIESDEHYIRFLKLYKTFGMKIVWDIIEYFDLEYFFKKIMISTLYYSRYVERHLDILYDEPDHHISVNIFREILEEGNDLKQLCQTLVEEYPEMYHLVADYEGDLGDQRTIDGFDEVFKWIDHAMCDIEYIIEDRK